MGVLPERVRADVVCASLRTIEERQGDEREHDVWGGRSIEEVDDSHGALNCGVERVWDNGMRYL